MVRFTVFIQFQNRNNSVIFQFIIRSFVYIRNAFRSDLMDKKFESGRKNSSRVTVPTQSLGTREKPYEKMHFLGVPKNRIFVGTRRIFLAVAIVCNNKLIFFQIFSIKRRLIFNLSPKFENDFLRHN
jgi:hypothetical protein